jgi:hypothetical protein
MEPRTGDHRERPLRRLGRSGAARAGARPGPGARPRRTGLRVAAVVDPGADEIEAIQERFGLPALAVEDAQDGHQRPKLEPVGWVEAAGLGEVYTYSVHYIGPSKAYKGDPPHVVALIDLDEGVRMMSNLVRDEAPDYPSIDPDDVSIGMRVRVVFHDVTDEITLPKFVPA